MEDIKVSIIIPMYNAARFIEAAVNALLNQTLKELEILVMDDCSTDDSAQIVQSTFGENERVRYFKMPQNGGPAKARNKGIELAKGQYVTFLDSDDGIVPGALERLYHEAVKYDADVAQSAGGFIPVMAPAPDNIMETPEELMVVIEKDAYTKESGLKPESTRECLKRLKEGALGGNVWGKLFRTEFLRENQITMPDMKLSEDVIFCFHCLMKAKNYVVTPYYSVIYRMVGDSLSKGTKTPAFMKKVLEAIWMGDRVMAKLMADMPYFKENPKEQKQLIAWLDQTMEDCYVRPAYQCLDRNQLEEDEEINALFETYFGESSEYVKLQFYSNHDNLPDVIDYFDNAVAYEGLKMALAGRAGASLPYFD